MRPPWFRRLFDLTPLLYMNPVATGILDIFRVRRLMAWKHSGFLF
jgi:hypothetical protein